MPGIRHVAKVGRILDFLLGDVPLSLRMSKLDRTKLYGSKDVEALDESDQNCELATLADDGRTLIGKGGTGLGWLDADGKWCSKSGLQPHDVNGDTIESVPSSFDEPIRLFETANADVLLDFNIRLVYSLSPDEPASVDQAAEEAESEASAAYEQLLRQLNKGTVFQFEYSYRGGSESDAAFLLMNLDGDLMMLVGTPIATTYASMNTRLISSDEEIDFGPDEGLVDFGMM